MADKDKKANGHLKAEETEEIKEAQKTDNASEAASTENKSDEQSSIEADAAERDEAAEKLKEAEEKLAAANDMYLRLRADFDNYRKRNAQIRTDSLTEGKAEVISKLLQTLDNFENALAVDCADKNYASGMEMIYKMLRDALIDMGVEDIPTDCMFDPNLHEAVFQEEVADTESGSIVKVIRKGYKFNGKVIRPSMVSVAK